MKKILFYLGIALVIISCTNKDDEAPVIVVEKPSHESIFLQGDTINFKATFTDNEALNQYKVDIHEGEGHTHKMGVLSEWSETITGDLTGTSEVITRSIIIPSDADTTEYHMIIQCTDAAGNEADIVEVHFDLEK